MPSVWAFLPGHSPIYSSIMHKAFPRTTWCGHYRYEYNLKACLTNLNGCDVDDFPIDEVHARLVQQSRDCHLQHNRLKQITPKKKGVCHKGSENLNRSRSVHNT